MIVILQSFLIKKAATNLSSPVFQIQNQPISRVSAKALVEIMLEIMKKQFYPVSQDRKKGIIQWKNSLHFH